MTNSIVHSSIAFILILCIMPGADAFAQRQLGLYKDGATTVTPAVARDDDKKKSMSQARIDELRKSGRVGTCEPGTASKDLDGNNVRARLFNNGGLFWNGSGSVYTVPRFGFTNAIRASGIWIAGLTTAGDIGTYRFAGTTYGPWEFWPGPLDANGTPPPDCSVYDRIFKVTRRDLQEFAATGTATADMTDWPTDLGAPFVDANEDGVYNLGDGDLPEVIGEQTAWWVMNDAGNVKGDSQSDPIGLEIQVTAFGFRTADDLNNTTFYKYKMIHKGDADLYDAYFGIWSDPDLGDASDDFVGSDTTLGLGFVYNGDDNDGGADGYEDYPPALGYDFFQGPLVNDDGIDNDKDGEIDEDNERIGMTRFVYYNNDSSVLGNPMLDTQEGYNYLRGRWRDGSFMTEGGNGYGGTKPTNYIFPGDPVTQAYWSEENTDDAGMRNAPGNRRFLMSAGPFTLKRGSVQEVVVGVVWAQGADRLASVAALRNADALAQAAFDIDFSRPPVNRAPVISAIGDQEHFVNNAVEINVTATDAEGDVLTFSATDLPPGVAIDPATGKISGTLTTGGIFNPTITAHDGYSTATASFTWTVRFIRFLTVANANGPLDPPDIGAFAFNDNGFPFWELGPSEFQDRPTSGYQQVLTYDTWGVHTGRSSAAGQSGTFMEFIGRSIRNGWSNIVPYDWEIRFTIRCYKAWRRAYDSGENVVANPTADGCYGYDRWGIYDGHSLQHVPFEIWRTGIATPNDPSDDVRMIVATVDWSADGWGIDPDDHPVDDGSDDPQTDWNYWYLPVNDAPGEAGYDAWLNDLIATCYGADTSGCNPSTHGAETFARIVFVNWNGANVVEDAFPDGPPDADMPEPGTIFRITTSEFATPVNIAGEVDLIERLGEGASTNVIVYPNPTSGYLQARIVHAEGGPLRVVLYDLQGRARLTLLEATAPEQFVATLRKDIDLPAGTYFIRLEANGVSHVKPITVVR